MTRRRVSLCVARFRLDKLELIEHAQRFAPEGTTARVYSVKTDGDKATEYKGAIVSIHEGQALQRLNDKGSFVAHQADGLAVDDVVQITYAGDKPGFS